MCKRLHRQLIPFTHPLAVISGRHVAVLRSAQEITLVKDQEGLTGRTREYDAQLRGKHIIIVS
jgi:hypothetical protein